MENKLTILAVITPPANNFTCPDCKHEFYNNDAAVYRDIQVAVLCPGCKMPQMICTKTHKNKWKSKCKAIIGKNKNGRVKFASCDEPICDRAIYDMEIVMEKKIDWCMRCNLLTHLRTKYKEELPKLYAKIKAEAAAQEKAAN